MISYPLKRIVAVRWTIHKIILNILSKLIETIIPRCSFSTTVNLFLSGNLGGQGKECLTQVSHEVKI